MPKRLTVFLLSLVLPCVLGGCKGPSAPGEEVAEYVLGTLCSVTLYEGASPEIFARVFSRFREIEEEMSANREDSVLNRIRRNAGLAPVQVSPGLWELLDRAVFYGELSGGAFDPTIGPLAQLWDTGAALPRIPGEKEIREKLALVDWRDLALDRERGTAFLRRPGMALDLGAIAKGYAADEAARLIAEAGLSRALVNLGGNILVWGKKPTAPGQPAAPWRIGIQDPLENRGDYLGFLEIPGGQSVVTSGVYERFFEAEGRRYHHLLSTETGYPLENGLLSVTILAGRSIDADALSTAVFARGWESGLALLRAVPGAEALLVLSGRRIRGSPGILARFTLTNPAYRLEESAPF
jgi:thiamine biosynthesis lipoprotein